MEVHAVVLWTRLVLHEVRAVLGGAEGGLEGPAVDEDVVDGADRAEGVIALVVRHIRTTTRTLKRNEGMSDQRLVVDFHDIVE